MDGDLISSSEAALILGVTRQRIGQLMKTYDDFPQPRVVGGRNIWLRSEVEAWAAEHPERPPGRRWPQQGARDGED